jgi:hypothetical protein
MYILRGRNCSGCYTTGQMYKEIYKEHNTECSNLYAVNGEGDSDCQYWQKWFNEHTMDMLV